MYEKGILITNLIKVLHVVHSLNDGGIERLLLEICKRIDRSKFEIQICCLTGLGDLAPEFEKLDIRLHVLDAKRDFSIVNVFVNLKKIFELRKLIKTENINITHGHEFYATVFSRISALLAGVKGRYITLHNMYYWWGFGIHFSQYVLSFITTRIICNSVSTMNYSLQKDKIIKRKYAVIYNGIDCEKFSGYSSDKKDFFAKLNLPPKDLVLVSIGNISPRKGYESAILAVNSIKNEFKSFMYFIVGGKHHQETDEYDRLNKIIKDNELEDLVLITGRRNDVEAFLSVCDFYLMPSVVEGFGISLAEALAMEKIVIASDIEPFKEIVDDGINGFFFKKGDYQDLAGRIKEVSKIDPEHLGDIRKKAREKVISMFDSGRMVEEYSKLYLETN